MKKNDLKPACPPKAFAKFHQKLRVHSVSDQIVRQGLPTPEASDGRGLQVILVGIYFLESDVDGESVFNGAGHTLPSKVRGLESSLGCGTRKRIAKAARVRKVAVKYRERNGGKGDGTKQDTA